MAGGGSARRGRKKPATPTFDYLDADGNLLVLRGSLTLGARREHADVLSGRAARPAATPEDAANRALELLFERLAVRWEIAGAPLTRQRDLLMRFRIASRQERAFVRDCLREHCEQLFPDVQVP